MGRCLIFFFFLGSLFTLHAQERDAGYFLDAHYFYGTVLRHNKDISHLVRKHPEGFILGFNQYANGSKRWHREYNMPDWGVSAVYQNFKTEALGENMGVYAHFNFYFLERHALLRIGQGIAYNTNPFDLETNFKNNAFGSHFLSSTYLLLHFNKPAIWRQLGLQAGLGVVHYSNANVKAPNTSANTLTAQIGISYEMASRTLVPARIDSIESRFSEPIALHLVVRAGINESDYVNLGQHPFVVVGGYLDKRLSYKSSVQAGAEVFFSEFIEKEIDYLVASRLDASLTGGEDYRRVGVFLGHELHFNRLALLTQAGYYVYYPYDFEGRFYQRIGLQYHVTRAWFLGATLKTHGAKAEAVEFGIGYRL
ncbi:MAG: deacylase [Flavobacteriaceae bacterium]|nr:deacylase [Flavobacteriaceae bacterium]